MKKIAIIPARAESKRLPDKPLRMIGTKPLVLHTYECVVNSKVFDEVYIAIDIKTYQKGKTLFRSQEYGLMDCPLPLDKICIIEDPCVNGTERVARAAQYLKLADDDLVVNVQGDIARISGTSLKAVVDAQVVATKNYVTTLCCELKKEEIGDSDVVKVLFDLLSNEAMAFSRNNQPASLWKKHIGVYAFFNLYLQKYFYSVVCERELKYNLEQFRIWDAPYNNGKINVIEVQDDPLVVDNEKTLWIASKELSNGK